MGTKTLAGQQHTVAWPAGSRGWCAKGPRIETRGSHHIIAHPISRQIGFYGSGVRVIRKSNFPLIHNKHQNKIFQFTTYFTDIENPEILGVPANIIHSTDEEYATAIVNWVEPTANDNSESQILTSNHSPGDSYPIGVTVVEYTSVDLSGNTETRSFTITINGMFND